MDRTLHKKKLILQKINRSLTIEMKELLKLFIFPHRKLSRSKFRFILTLGATKPQMIEICDAHNNEMSEDAKRLVQKLNDTINNVESSWFYPAPFRIRFIEGMSGQAFRGLLNLLFSDGMSNYLEIGSWKGSTVCGVLHGNHVKAVCIDDWSQFTGPAGIFFKNVGTHLNRSSRLTVISRDFRKVDFGGLFENFVDVYFFDGPHTEEDHIDGVKVIESLNFKTLLFIVDDWNDETVRRGTSLGIKTLVDSKVAFVKEIFTSTERSMTTRWHNGCAFFIIEKVVQKQV